MDKKLSEVEIQKLKKKSDEANTLIRASKVNSHCGMSFEVHISLLEIN
ncbi:hypothetical protein OA416_01495 [Paracoccaceae bacterium]|nr:hypothetical protein [Paracoccaceae bacterium]